MGYDFDSVITMDDLVSSDDVFFAATGITDGELLEGVHYTHTGAHHREHRGARYYRHSAYDQVSAQLYPAGINQRSAVLILEHHSF